MSLMEARRRNTSALRLRFSQSFARRRHLPSQANVRSTTHRRGRTSNPFANSDRFTISVLRCGAEFLALISAIGEEFAEERKQTKQRRQHESATVSILDICRVHDGVHQQAVRIDENVPLLAFDLLSRVVTGRVNRRPPFSALFTL